MKTRILSFALLSLLGACQSSNDETPQNPSHPSSSQSPQRAQSTSEYSIKHLGSRVHLAEDHSNLDEYIENINVHKMRLTAIDGLNSNGSIQCKKLVAGQLDNVYSARFNQTGKTTEILLSLFPADPIATEFSCRINDSLGQELKEIKFTVPKNIVVQSKTTLPELHNQKIGTLLLTADAEIITEGRPLNLEVKNLISLNGTLSTFEISSIDLTPADTQGKDGGMIKINAEEAQGSLTVNLRGTNGGRQSFVAQRPPKAHAGARGTCHERSSPRSCDGQNGQPGYPAVNGKDGLKGGSTGSIDFILSKKSDFELMIIYSAGLGSEGAKASLPGEGGDGGAPGSVHIRNPNCGPGRTTPMTDPSNCLTVITGQPGISGALGEYGVDGLPGSPGRNETSRFLNAAEGQNEFINGSWSNIKGNLE